MKRASSRAVVLYYLQRLNVRPISARRLLPPVPLQRSLELGINHFETAQVSWPPLLDACGARVFAYPRPTPGSSTLQVCHE